jgi:hypothetical protein
VLSPQETQLAQESRLDSSSPSGGYVAIAAASTLHSPDVLQIATATGLSISSLHYYSTVSISISIPDIKSDKKEDNKETFLQQRKSSSCYKAIVKPVAQRGKTWAIISVVAIGDLGREARTVQRATFFDSACPDLHCIWDRDLARDLVLSLWNCCDGGDSMDQSIELTE